MFVGLAPGWRQLPQVFGPGELALAEGFVNADGSGEVMRAVFRLVAAVTGQGFFPLGEIAEPALDSLGLGVVRLGVTDEKADIVSQIDTVAFDDGAHTGFAIEGFDGDWLVLNRMRGVFLTVIPMDKGGHQFIATALHPAQEFKAEAAFPVCVSDGVKICQGDAARVGPVLNVVAKDRVAGIVVNRTNPLAVEARLLADSAGRRPIHNVELPPVHTKTLAGEQAGR